MLKAGVQNISLVHSHAVKVKWQYGMENQATHNYSPGVAQRSKALHLSARGIPGSILGCITTGRDWETHRTVHNWLCVVRVRVWPG